jgi:RecJ-like exonuclease
MWQKCPICKGSGYQWIPLSNSTNIKCRRCKGEGIISEITGLPPEPQFKDNSNLPSTDIYSNVDNIKINPHGNVQKKI